MFDAKAIILKILEIIEYQKDRNQMANEFIDLCCRKAFVSCLSTLPEEKRAQMEKAVNSQKDIDSATTELLKFVSRDLYIEKLGEISKETLTDYIASVMPVLTGEKQLELKSYLATIKTA